MRHDRIIRFPELLMSACAVLAASSVFAADPWVVYEGGDGPGRGKHIVLVSGDDEYRSEEALPMLGRILAKRHGFKCTVLFAINPADGTIKPDHQTNIPGLESLDSADLMIMFLRFRNLPDDQMKHIVDFVNAGGPVIGLRTSTHAFNYPQDSHSAYKKYSFNSRDPKGGFGQQILGDTWISHHGRHGSQSTRGVINDEHADHPVLRGVEDVWGPTDVYGIRNLLETDKILMHGAVLEGMRPDDKPVEGKQNDPMMPLVWIREFETESGNTCKVLNTTMGASVDLLSEDLRRLVVNGVYWGTGMADQIPQRANVDVVGEYQPTMFGFGKYTKGLTPDDFR